MAQIAIALEILRIAIVAQALVAFLALFVAQSSEIKNRFLRLSHRHSRRYLYWHGMRSGLSSDIAKSIVRDTGAIP